MGLDDHQPFWETLLLLQSLALIGWSVIRPSQVLLYSGAFFLLVDLIDINFEHFAGRIGLPAALLITGIAFMAVGLGVRRLRRRSGRRPAARATTGRGRRTRRPRAPHKPGDPPPPLPPASQRRRVCPKIVGQLLAVVLQSGQPDKIGTHPR
jgi:hypothetical protein